MKNFIFKHKRKFILLILLCFFVVTSINISAYDPQVDSVGDSLVGPSGTIEEFSSWSVPAEYKNLYEQNFFKHLNQPAETGLNLDGALSALDLLFRNFSWGIINFLASIVGALENIFFKFVTMFDVFSLIFNNNTSLFGGLAVITIFIGIVVAGFRIANPFSEDGLQFVKLLIKGLATVVFMLAIAGFSYGVMEDITSATAEKLIKNEKTGNTLVTNVLKDNVIDIEESVNKKQIVKVNKNKISYIDITSKISDRDHEILGYKYNETGKDKFERAKLNKNNNILLSMKSSEFHYKYHFNFFSLFVVLGGLAALYSLNTLKFIRNTYEMFIVFITFIISSVDITNQDRLKANINNVLGLFFNNIYLIGSVFLASNFILIANTLLPIITKDMGSIETAAANIFAYLAIFWLMLDGAAIIQQVTGTDGGIRSGSSVILGAYGAGKLFGALGGNLAQSGLNLASKAKNNINSKIEPQVGNSKTSNDNDSEEKNDTVNKDKSDVKNDEIINDEKNGAEDSKEDKITNPAVSDVDKSSNNNPSRSDNAFKSKNNPHQKDEKSNSKAKDYLAETNNRFQNNNSRYYESKIVKDSSEFINKNSFEEGRNK